MKVLRLVLAAACLMGPWLCWTALRPSPRPSPEPLSPFARSILPGTSAPNPIPGTAAPPPGLELAGSSSPADRRPPVGSTALTLPSTRPGEDAFAAFHQWLESRSASLAGSLDLDAGIALARRRRVEMEDLLQSDPERALELALPDAVRLALPPPMADLVERRLSGRGDLEVLAALPEPGRESEVRPIRRFAVLQEERYEAFVYGRRRSEPTLRNVSLHGIAVGRLAAIAESPVRVLDPGFTPSTTHAGAGVPPVCPVDVPHPASGPETVWAEAFGTPVSLCCREHLARYEEDLVAAAASLQSAGSAATLGVKRLIFIRVDFTDLAGAPFSEARAAVLARDLHGFYQQNSLGRAGFRELEDGSAVTPVLRMPRTAASYGSNDDAGDLRNDARRAARSAGYVLEDFDYDLICMGSVPGFGWAGLGYIGAPGAWIRGTSSTGVTAHELGHNYGLPHANFWDTAGESVTGPGLEIEYGDKFDTMGAANAGNYHFNARYKRLLGWLQNGEFTVATTNGTYRILAHDQTNAVAGSRGLQVFANARTNYWLEFRQRFTGNPWLLNGAGLRWAGRGGESSVLLDTTPGSARDKDDSPLLIGRTFSDPHALVHLTPVARGGGAGSPAWLDIVVHRGPTPGNRRPSLALHPSSTTGSTTTEFEFRAEADDPDGDALAYAWEFGDNLLGENAPQVRHQWAAAGEYRVQCTASDMRGGVARASVLVRVGSPSNLRLGGRVTAYGEPVGGIRIQAGQGRQAVTDDDGEYQLTGLPRGFYTLNALAPDGTRFQPVGFSIPVNLTVSRSDLHFAAAELTPQRPVTLVAGGALWRYWDQGTSPGDTWRASAHDDSGWNEGPAILGYGGDRETTVIGFGPNSGQKHLTAWFRRGFTVPDPAQLTRLTLGLLRDDGAVVYLNGVECVRDNMPAGTITAQTRAASTVGGSAEVTYFEHALDPALLVAGTNVLAVEVHQASPSSSDLAFDLRLTAEVHQSPEPGVRLVRPEPGESFVAPARIVLSAVVGPLPGEAIERVAFFTGSRRLGESVASPYSHVWNHAPAGDHTVTAEAHFSSGRRQSSEPVAVVVVDPDLAPVLIPRGSVWRYLDTGAAPGNTWTTSAFEDQSWAMGPARLGYGEDGESTVVSFGPDPALKHVTTWFRHRFDVVDADTITNLVWRLQRDDAAVVYLNGHEVFRLGLGAGTVTPGLLAQAEVTNDAEQLFVERALPPTPLAEGRNVVAVEVHQSSRSSSDLGFDLELTGRRARLPVVPRLTWRLEAGILVLRWPAELSGWRLESASILAGGLADSWQAVEGIPATVEGFFEQTAEPPDAVRFFRLTRPNSPEGR